jgi:hypothetical protein
MESYPTVRLSIRITKSNTEPMLCDLITPPPKQKLKNVSFGSVDIFYITPRQKIIICGLCSPIPAIKPIQKKRRFSI